ncbi:MAG: histidinol dehydrogenase [Bacteroidetes bacterium]|nr:histidinol dehydrogenase [Bacteroidota bacterium]MBI3483178.1 histidinol dehydrogenase [Bacteroidota bacterium]
MKIFNKPDKSIWDELCKRPQLQTGFLESSVQNILARVKTSGDSALRELTLQFDKAQLTDFRVSQSEIDNAIDQTPIELKNAIEIAYKNIEKFHAAQKRELLKIETIPGVVCWRKTTAIEKIGIYIPGGSAPLFSTVLMLGIPAKLASCNDMILCTPPEKNGKINPAILFAAQLVGIKQIFKVGGAQAIAALAYGTESVPKVYKIFGPGNQFVTKAKQLVSMEGVAIDMPAGPSEVLVLADANANPSFIAADLLSQAEHGEDSKVVLVTSDQSALDRMLLEIENQVVKLPRREIAQKALANSQAVILDKEQAIEFVNLYAPEHLIINTNDCDELVEKITNAGSIFLGAYTPESAGDYASGTNHTLPTNGFAKSYGGVSLESFLKYITVQKISKEGIKNLGPTIEIMAEAEELKGHAEAVRIRY